MSELPVDGVDERVALVPVADVRPDRQRATAGGLLHLARHRLAVVELAARDHDVGARSRVAEHDRPADAPAPTGDDGDLAGEVEQVERRVRGHQSRSPRANAAAARMSLGTVSVMEFSPSGTPAAALRA